MDNKEYAIACTEVLEILKSVKQNDLEKIPNSEIEKLKRNADSKYVCKYNPNVDIKEQNISKMAKGIIAVYFTDFIATSTQRDIILKKQKKDLEILEEEKRNQYSYENLFKNIKKNTSINVMSEVHKENLPDVIKKENIFIRLCKFIIKKLRLR